MYEELTKRLRYCSEEQNGCGMCELSWDCVLRVGLLTQAADAIEELTATAESYKRSMEMWAEEAARAQPRWIPTTERLPEFDQKVLAWVKNKDPEGRFNKDGIYTAELEDKMPKPDPEGKRNFWGIPGYDSVWTVWSWSYFTEPDVLFWMPLPEPPKEET